MVPILNNNDIMDGSNAAHNEKPDEELRQHSVISESEMFDNIGKKTARFNVYRAIKDPTSCSSDDAYFPKAYEWILVNDVSNHICCCKEMFVSYSVNVENEEIALGNGQLIASCGQGTVYLKYRSEQKIRTLKFHNVHYVPGFCNLLSFRTADLGSQLEKINSKYTWVQTQSKENIELKIVNDLVVLPFECVIDNSADNGCKPEMFLSTQDKSILWHGRLAHLNERSIHHVLKQYVLKDFGEHTTNSFDQPSFSCMFCEDNQLFAHETFTPTIEYAQAIGVGIEITAVSITKYFTNVPECFLVAIQDMYSGFVVGIVGSSVENLKLHISMMLSLREEQIKTKVQIVVARNLPAELKPLVEQLDLWNQEHFKLVYEHTKGTATNLSDRLAKIINRILFATGMSPKLWYKTVHTASTLYNVTTINAHKNGSAYECFFLKPPKWERFRSIGCIAIAHTSKHEQKVCMMLGYEQLTEDYLLFDCKTRAVFACKNALFLEEDTLYRNALPNRPFPMHTLTMQAGRKLKAGLDMADDTIIYQATDIFERLKHVEITDKDAIWDAIVPIERTLRWMEQECHACIIRDTEEVISIPRSPQIDGYSMQIQHEFDLYFTCQDASSLYSSLSIATFGNPGYTLLFRLLLLRHVVQNWDQLRNHYHLFLGETFGQCVESLIIPKNTNYDTHLYFLSDICQRPILIHEFDSNLLRIKLHYYNSTLANECKQPIYLFFNGAHFQPLIPKSKLHTIFSITKQKSQRRFAKWENGYVYNHKLVGSWPVQVWRAIRLPQFRNSTQCALATEIAESDVNKDVQVTSQSITNLPHSQPCKMCADVTSKFKNEKRRCEQIKSILNNGVSGLAKELLAPSSCIASSDQFLENQKLTEFEQLKSYCAYLDWLGSVLCDFVSYCEKYQEDGMDEMANLKLMQPCFYLVSMTLSDIIDTINEIEKHVPTRLQFALQQPDMLEDVAVIKCTRNNTNTVLKKVLKIALHDIMKPNSDGHYNKYVTALRKRTNAQLVLERDQIIATNEPPPSQNQIRCKTTALDPPIVHCSSLKDSNAKCQQQNKHLPDRLVEIAPFKPMLNDEVELMDTAVTIRPLKELQKDVESSALPSSSLSVSSNQVSEKCQDPDSNTRNDESVLEPKLATRSTQAQQKCVFCDRLIDTVAELKHHLIMFHAKNGYYKINQTAQEPKVKRNAEIKRQSKTRINALTKVTPHKYRTRRHKSNEDDIQETKLNTTNLQLTCPICGSDKFSCKSTFNRHIRGHRMKFQCSLCTYTATRRDNLNTHYQRKHVNKQPFNCPYCKRVFAGEKTLTNHIKACHPAGLVRIVENELKQTNNKDI